MNNNLVTIIIVTYKSAHIISKALEQIINKGFRIIIIDNDSRDNLENIIADEYSNKEIELIKLPKNIGFGRANNIALARIKTKYAFLLNPDAFIIGDALEKLIHYMEKDKNIALAGAFDVKKIDPSKDEIINAVNNHKKTVEIIKENQDLIETSFICGGYMLLNMSVFIKLGFFDENLFLYGEDEELCDRVIANKYKIIQVKTAFVYHQEHSATKTKGMLEKYLLLYKRYSHMGWSRVYLKRKRGKANIDIFISLVFQLLSSFLYLACFSFRRFIIRFARAKGGISNLLLFKKLK